jgi:hypothetical protein
MSRSYFTFAILCILAYANASHAQPSQDSLIRHTLSLVDYPEYVRTGPPPPMNARLGLYFNEYPADSVRAITHGADTMKGNKIWHVAPHWSADNAGVMVGDIVLRVNGRTLADSVYGPDDVLNTRLRSMHVGDTLDFELIRDRVVRHINVPLTGGKRIIMHYDDYHDLGAIRTDSWLEKTLAEKNMRPWADTIAKQMASIADLDFCDAPFTERPNPFRLNAVTYLDHHPLRVGALSRLIDEGIWGWLDRQGPASAVDQAYRHLSNSDPSLAPSTSIPPPPRSPTTLQAVTDNLRSAQTLVTRAYADAGVRLDSLSYGLANLLNVDSNWEDALDTSNHNALQQLAARNRDETMLEQLFGAADRVHFDELNSASKTLLLMSDTSWLREFVKGIPTKRRLVDQHAPGVEGSIIMTWMTPAGRCVIGGGGPNRYTGEFAFVLDIGGDDVYDLPACKPGHVRFIADMVGNDIYTGAQSAASGVGCVDVLVDVSGDDTYRGSRWSQGSGCLGVGVLIDYAGNDVYTSHWASQGAAFLGIGLLYDHGGDDHYISDIYSQGFGYTKGFGMLLDRNGNDAYRAGWKYPDARWPNRAHLSMSQGFGYGMRPWSTGVGTDGGIGLLSDRHGDDTYDADYFSQGGSYWYALGILHDWQGADRYNAGQYSQGSGIHLSFGALLDDQGDDSYDAYAWLEQGNAHDWSAGALEDYDGNDTYRSSGASQGCGFFVSFAYLLDAHGDDRYYCKITDTTNSQGGGNYIPPRNSGSLGILLDLGHGDDAYTDQRIIPGEAVVKSQRGVAWDDGVPGK